MAICLSVIAHFVRGLHELSHFVTIVTLSINSKQSVHQISTFCDIFHKQMHTGVSWELIPIHKLAANITNHKPPIVQNSKYRVQRSTKLGAV